MGNKIRSGSRDQFEQMVHEVRKDQSRRVTVNPQKKYRDHMIEELETTKFPDKFKEILRHTLTHKISQIQLIDTITCINTLKNNKFQLSNNRGGSILKDKPESKFVKINFGQAFFKNIFKKLPINFNVIREQQGSIKNIHDLSPTRLKKSHSQKSTTQKVVTKQQEGEMKQKLKNVGQVMKKQLSKSTHPFVKLTKSLAQFVQTNSLILFPPQSQKGKEEAYEKGIKQFITQWCNYLESSCLQPYRKWIMSYVGLEEVKYIKWIKNIILQQIWVTENGYLFNAVLAIIQNNKLPVNIDWKQIESFDALLTPSLFNIDPKLQIEGNFFDSIYQMSELSSKLRPEQILSHLETVKKRICSDIDNYHRLIEKGQIFQIDSDNILGIVSYILCKIASKIDEIHSQLIFLRIIYGQNVYFSMGVGSYMLSTIFGALQFLQSEQFRELIYLNKEVDQTSDEKRKSSLSVKKTSSKKQQELQLMDKNKFDEAISYIYSMITTTKQLEQQYQI